MRAIIVASALAGAAAACSAPATNGTAAYDRETVAAEVTALAQHWAQAGSEGRFEELKTIYADEDGFAWIEQGRLAYGGHDAIEVGLDQAAAMNAKISTSIDNIVVTPLALDAAAMIADVAFSVTSEAFAFDFDGVFSAVAIKRDGKWTFLQGHLSEPPKA